METQTRGKGTIDHGLQGSVGTLADANPTRLSKRSQGCPLTAKSTIHKAQEDMTRYYNWRRSLAPIFKLGDWVYLDMSDIKTTHLSPKLSHRRLEPFEIECQVGPLAYQLKLSHRMRQLYPVFNVVKLSAALDNLISGRKLQALLPPIVIDGEPKWEVEEILDSCWHQRRFQFLIKWKGFSREHNSWEVVVRACFTHKAKALRS